MIYDPAKMATDLDFVEGLLRVVKDSDYTVYLLVEDHNEKIYVINVIEN